MVMRGPNYRLPEKCRLRKPIKQINNNIMPIIGGGNIMQPVLQNTVIDNNISNFGPDSEINYNNKF